MNQNTLNQNNLNQNNLNQDTLKTFASLDLSPPIQTALREQGYESPTPIQSQTIPAAVSGQDILGCAQTGTGKTAAFALPILDYFVQEKPRTAPKRPLVLVLAPTRELAIQIGQSFNDYGKHVRYRQAMVYGGVSQGSQVKSLRDGVHLLIATPGRLIDLMDQGHIDLGDIEIFVLDEADRMMDMGFMPALKRIIRELPEERQSLFFSATMPPKIRELASSMLFNPFSVDVTPKTPSVKQIVQRVLIVERPDKLTALLDVLAGDGVCQTIVFTRTKRGANALAKKLDRSGVRAAAIHGDKSQNARQQSLDHFRRGKVGVLVATDVAARGIDIDGVTHVINYDMPEDAESYVHRIGRTGRAGADGIAISFCTLEQRDELLQVEKLIGQRITIDNPEACRRWDSPAAGRTASAGRPAGTAASRRGRSKPRRPLANPSSRDRSNRNELDHSDVKQAPRLTRNVRRGKKKRPVAVAAHA